MGNGEWGIDFMVGLGYASSCLTLPLLLFAIILHIEFLGFISNDFYKQQLQSLRR